MKPVLSCVLACTVLAIAGCKKQPPELRADPRVSVQRPTSEVTVRPGWTSATYPARYERAALPTFPAEAVEAQVDRATVRADFTVLVDGRARDIQLTMLNDVPAAELFLAACDETLARWRFSPAWRLANGDERSTTSVVLVPSKAHLIFHFNLAVHQSGGDVGMTFGAGGP